MSPQEFIRWMESFDFDDKFLAVEGSDEFEPGLADA